MEVEKKNSKGGFLSYFDWGGKSKKKLFPNNNGGEMDGIKKATENLDEHVPRFRLVEYDQNRANLTCKGSGEFNCGSSMSSDDGCRPGAPSVVARLMGLDSMPNVNVCEPFSTQNMDSRFLRNECIPGSGLNPRDKGFHMNYWNFSYDQDTFSRPPFTMTPQKMHGRPIERFQTEMLPPRYVKTIPVTHHKLLSPIKSPRFIPTKNAAYIMEAASKIIEPNPRTAINGRMAPHASPSVPLRIRDLKERMEASEKSLRLQKAEANAMRNNVYRKEAKTSNGSVNMPNMKVPLRLGRSRSESSKSRGKVGPRTEVVNSTIQRREAYVSSSIQNFPSQKVYIEAVSKQAVKKLQRSEQQRVGAVKTSGVPRKNNQKQNDALSGDSLASNSSVSNSVSTKSLTINSSMRINKTAQKSATDDETRFRKDLIITDTREQYPMSKGMKARQQKRSKNGIHQSEHLMSDTVLLSSKHGKYIHCNTVTDDGSSWALGNNKDGMDVISFTFASPIKKPVSKSEDTRQVTGGYQPTGDGFQNLPGTKMLSLSPQRFNGIGADALGTLLEKKLELTCRFNSSSGNNFNETHYSSFEDSVPSSSVTKISSEEYNNTSQFCIVSANSDSVTEPESTSDDLFLIANSGVQEIEDCYSVNKKNKASKIFLVEPSSVLYAEDACSSEGCCSFSENNCSIQDNMGCWEVTFSEATDMISAESCNQTETNPKLSYSCSVYTAPTTWESQYIRDVISQAELLAKNYLLGEANNVIDSNLFYHIENQPDSYADGSSNKLERKLLFDCISELTNHRCQQLTTGSSGAWSKWPTPSEQDRSFSQELYKDIFLLKNMEELMVDEVVEKDMSSGRGKWVDFDREAAEECSEMEDLVISSLVDELVTDLVSSVLVQEC